jgi:hypothetical protein
MFGSGVRYYEERPLLKRPLHGTTPSRKVFPNP